MELLLPDKKFLKKTGDVDYFDWNYTFPISYIQRFRFKKIIKLLGENKFNKLLEIGIGSGIFLPELSKHCDELYGCDIYDDYSNVKELCKRYNIKKFHVKKENIQCTTYKDDFFDLIVAVSVLEFVNDIQVALDEIKRILSPKGYFVTLCPMENKIADKILSLYSSKKPEEEFGDSRSIISLYLEENFKVIDKGYMIPFLSKHFPVYTFYKLQK